MNNYRYEVDGHNISMFGILNENAQLPDLNDLGNEVFFDLSGVTYINSFGVKRWCRWVDKHMPTGSFKKISLAGLPVSFVQAANMIPGFLPQISIVESFHVPIFCEETQEEGRIQLVKGDHYELPLASYQEINYKELIADGFEADIMADKYYKFLVNS